MSIVNIDKEIKEEVLKHQKDGESFANLLSRLLDECNLSNYEYGVGRSSVQIHDDDLKRLKSLKRYSTESYSAVILRVLLSLEGES